MAALTSRDCPTQLASSAGGIVLRYGDDGLELLIGRRRNERSGSTWSLPKGTPDAGETTEQTALREDLQEIGDARHQ